jgi:hypothetical protein
VAERRRRVCVELLKVEPNLWTFAKVS